jgi:nitrate reductase gamma subunit
MWVALIAVLILIAVPWIGVGAGGLSTLFGIGIPYVACLIFFAGFIYRIVKWAQSPVPFHIPTVCGQQQSLSWIKTNNIESPHSYWGVFTRMVLEVLLFRSLLRNDRTELKPSQKLVYSSNRYLWAGGMLFHWSLLIILFRHLRFFTEPVLPGIALAQSLDALFHVGLPALYLTDAAIIVSLSYLFARRIIYPQIRLISLPSDYFALLLIIAVVFSGVLMRHFFKIDAEKAKELIISIVSLRPAIPTAIGLPFYTHLFLVCALAAYFPFSKLMHAPGVFLSPTRNLQNDSRARRHINPWSYPVKVHTYEEYEAEFGEAMKEAGLPVEKE